MVLSSIRFYGETRKIALPGTWFVAVLGRFGVRESAIRQTLYRLQNQRVLKGRTLGRRKLYSLTAAGRVPLDAGTRKIFGRMEDEWDGDWTIIHFHLGEELRFERNRLRDVLSAEGFRSPGPGLYVHPRDRAETVLRTARHLGVSHGLWSFRGRWVDQKRPRHPTKLWDLAKLRTRYRRFISSMESMVAAPVLDDPQTAFGLRLAVVREYLSVAWDDPELPPDLLPADWPGADARRLAKAIYERLAPPALAYGDEKMEDVLRGEKARRPSVRYATVSAT